MSITSVKKHLKKYNLEDRVLEFNSSSATVSEAAECLNVSEGEIAKSLTFMVYDTPIVIVVAGDKKIDNSKFKSEFSCKAKMISSLDVESLIGHAVGGVCPFAVNEGVNIYLDVSLKEHKIIYPACGSSNSAVKLSIEELEKCSNYLKWVNVCKDV